MSLDRRVPDAAVPLVGDGLVLSAFTDDDVPTLLTAFADPDIRGYNPGPAAAEGTVGVEEWFRNRNDWSSGGHASWAVRAPGGELLGSVSLFDVSDAQLLAEVGYWVVPAARGRGVATRGVCCAVRYAFETLGLHRVYLHHAVENSASCRVAVAAGFLLEGTLRQSWRYGDGLFHDDHLHGRLASDVMPHIRSRASTAP